MRNTPTFVSSLPRARRHHHRSWLVHAARIAPRLSAARQYCTASAGREFHRSRTPLPSHFSLLAAPRAGAPGKSSRTDNTVARLFEGNTDFGGARTDADTPRTANNWHKHRANTDRSRPVRRPNINQRFQPTRPSRLTRSYDPVLHALPPRLMHSLQARGHCSTASQSPKWPPRTQSSVIAIQSSERSEATRRPFKEEP